MTGDASENPCCRICGRSLLPGERPIELVSVAGDWATVCSLCKPSAETAGWLRPEEAAALRERGGARERGRPRGQLLAGVLSRGRQLAGRARSERAPRARNGGRPRRGAEPGRHSTGSRERSAAGAASPTVTEALEAFNVSQHRRTVRGLTRSLGEPRASGLAIRTDNGATGARLTVAWELAWYQWEVAPGERGLEVRESRKGETIDQLRAADRTWNLMAASDGTLSARGKPASDSPE